MEYNGKLYGAANGTYWPLMMTSADVDRAMALLRDAGHLLGLIADDDGPCRTWTAMASETGREIAGFLEGLAGRQTGAEEQQR